jgi:hypothetical protein
MTLACLSGQNAGAQAIAVDQDGCVKGQFHCGKGPKQAVVFQFGLPTVPAETRSREHSVLRTLWVKNGVRYLQTVLVADGVSSATGQSRPVLLVNIEGDNTNPEYTEAFAELVVETGGKRQLLELNGGFVWCVAGESRSLVGALEIPESGIKVARGEALKFYGSIPPSLKGAMTFKIPLEPLVGTEAADWLLDLEFEGALRRALRAGDVSKAHTNSVPLVFADEERTESGKL